MILVVCTDDPTVTDVANQSAATNPAVYGQVYQVNAENVPQLGGNEDLFIVAHGTSADAEDGNPVIGSESNDFYVNAVDLYQNIKEIFPDGYSGNVYIDACYSADPGAGEDGDELPSFVEAFTTQIQVDHGDVEVFGRTGTVDGLIPAPGDPGWQADGTFPSDGDEDGDDPMSEGSESDSDGDASMSDAPPPVDGGVSGGPPPVNGGGSGGPPPVSGGGSSGSQSDEGGSPPAGGGDSGFSSGDSGGDEGFSPGDGEVALARRRAPARKKR